MSFFICLPEAFTSASLRSRRHKLCTAHFRAKHENLTHAVVPPLPKKSNDFSRAPTVIAQSYLIQPVIQMCRPKKGRTSPRNLGKILHPNVLGFADSQRRDCCTIPRATVLNNSKSTVFTLSIPQPCPTFPVVSCWMNSMFNCYSVVMLLGANFYDRTYICIWIW